MTLASVNPYRAKKPRRRHRPGKRNPPPARTSQRCLFFGEGAIDGAEAICLALVFPFCTLTYLGFERVGGLSSDGKSAITISASSTRLVELEVTVSVVGR
jgi:hypothetical protein